MCYPYHEVEVFRQLLSELRVAGTESPPRADGIEKCHPAEVKGFRVVQK